MLGDPTKEDVDKALAVLAAFEAAKLAPAPAVVPEPIPEQVAAPVDHYEARSFKSSATGFG